MIQRREIGGVDFNKGWQEYMDGFGTPGFTGDFWLGRYSHKLQNKYRIILLKICRNVDKKKSN